MRPIAGGGDVGSGPRPEGLDTAPGGGGSQVQGGSPGRLNRDGGNCWYCLVMLILVILVRRGFIEFHNCGIVFVVKIITAEKSVLKVTLTCYTSDVRQFKLNSRPEM